MLSHRCHTGGSHTDGIHTDDGHTMVTLHYGFYALCILVWPLVALLRRCAVSGWLDRAQLAGWWWWCGRQPAAARRWCRVVPGPVVSRRNCPDCCAGQHHQPGPSSRLNNYNTSAHLRLASSPATSTMCSGGLNKHRGAPQSHLRCGVKYFLVVTEYFPADVEQEHYLAWPGVTSGDHLHISASPHITSHSAGVQCPRLLPQGQR